MSATGKASDGFEPTQHRIWSARRNSTIPVERSAAKASPWYSFYILTRICTKSDVARKEEKNSDDVVIREWPKIPFGRDDSYVGSYRKRIVRKSRGTLNERRHASSELCSEDVSSLLRILARNIAGYLGIRHSPPRMTQYGHRDRAKQNHIVENKSFLGENKLLWRKRSRAKLRVEVSRKLCSLLDGESG